MATSAGTTTIEVTGITEDVMRRLSERARSCDRTVSEYLRGLIEEDVMREPVAGRRTVDEILAPVREDFARSGMTEAELDQMVEEIREEIWREKQAAQGEHHVRSAAGHPAWEPCRRSGSDRGVGGWRPAPP